MVAIIKRRQVHTTAIRAGTRDAFVVEHYKLGRTESRHSPLRDIQAQSCRLGTEMLGTSASVLTPYVASMVCRALEMFKVPDTCLPQILVFKLFSAQHICHILCPREYVLHALWINVSCDMIEMTDYNKGFFT
ncbi:unnamed protein product, partial [Porites lobata]